MCSLCDRGLLKIKCKLSGFNFFFLLHFQTMPSTATNALIQGCSRGLGLQFCKSLLARQPGLNVIATCRSPETATELQAIKADSSCSDRLHLIKLDVKKESDIKVWYAS